MCVNLESVGKTYVRRFAARCQDHHVALRLGESAVQPQGARVLLHELGAERCLLLWKAAVTAPARDIAGA